LAAATWSRRDVTAGVAPALALALVGLAGWRLSHMLELSAAFQEPEMAHARAVFARKVEPGAVVITTEDVGRPAENIEYYSGVAHALYLTDLERWGLTVGDAAELLAHGGMKPYLHLPKAHPGLDRLLAALGRRFTVELAADIPARRAVDYFVAAQFLPEGIHMQLHRLGPLGAGVPCRAAGPALEARGWSRHDARSLRRADRTRAPARRGVRRPSRWRARALRRRALPAPGRLLPEER